VQYIVSKFLVLSYEKAVWDLPSDQFYCPFTNADHALKTEWPAQGTTHNADLMRLNAK